MRLIDADAMIDEWCNECRRKPNCEEDCAFYEAVALAPTINTKQIKYFDEGESVWKVGSVIVDE